MVAVSKGRVYRLPATKSKQTGSISYRTCRSKWLNSLKDNKFDTAFEILNKHSEMSIED